MRTIEELQIIITTALASDKAARMKGLVITTLAVECGLDRSYFQAEPDDPSCESFWMALKNLEESNKITPASVKKEDYDLHVRYNHISNN